MALPYRPWLTVKETAKAFSKELGSKIKESDIFRYALDHKLMLSVNFAGAVGGTYGYYHTEWNDTHELGVSRFKPSDGPPRACGFEVGDLELTYSLWRVIVDNIHRKLRGLPVWSLPTAEMGLAVHFEESRYSELADKFYFCYGTLFMVENVSYDEETGRLKSRSPADTVTEGVFVVRTDEIQKFIESVKEIAQLPDPAAGNAKNSIPAQAEAPDDIINEEVPGKLPRIAVSKLAIQIAWDIERKTKQPATAKEVMTELQSRADNGTHPDTLMKADRNKRAVFWITGKSKEKDFSLMACEKALETWRKSRR